MNVSRQKTPKRCLSGDEKVLIRRKNDQFQHNLKALKREKCGIWKGLNEGQNGSFPAQIGA